MENLKNTINNFIGQNFINLSHIDKILLTNISLKKVFSLPYYKNTYYISSIAIKDNLESSFLLNEYDAGSRIIDRALFDIKYDIPDRNDLFNIDKYLVDKSVFSRINTFIEINKSSSNDIYNYVDKIIEAQKGDNEFLNTLYSFQYLIPKYDTLFFNNDVKKLLEFNGVKDINSTLCKNTFSTFNDDNTYYWDNIKEQWKDQETERQEALHKTLKITNDINVYYDKYKNEIQQVIDYLKMQKEHLFKNTNEQNIQFSYYEVKGSYENDIYEFKLQDRLNISQNILSNNGITISDIYSIKHNSDSHLSFKETIMNNLMKKDDDLSPNIKSHFYGLDFLNPKSMLDGPYAKSYILAKVNNDIVGFISFKSTDSEGLSTFKTIEYVCVKENFRGTGLSEKLYDKLASILDANGNILTNSHYTEQGRVKLPRLKQRIREKHPNFLMIDTDLGYSEDLTPKEQKLMDIKSYFNESFCIDLKTLEKKNPELFKTKIKDIATLYNESIRYIDNHQKAFTHSDRAISKTIQNRFMSRQTLKLNGILNTLKRNVVKNIK
ncbi:GNAT family N-acetyltransferase [Shigella flexneri]